MAGMIEEGLVLVISCDVIEYNVTTSPVGEKAGGGQQPDGRT